MRRDARRPHRPNFVAKIPVEDPFTHTRSKQYIAQHEELEMMFEWRVGRTHA